MWKKYGTAGEATNDNKTRRMRFASWIIKVTDTHSKYGILDAFPRQKWFRERASISRYTCIASLIITQMERVSCAVRTGSSYITTFRPYEVNIFINLHSDGLIWCKYKFISLHHTSTWHYETAEHNFGYTFARPKLHKTTAKILRNDPNWTHASILPN